MSDELPGMEQGQGILGDGKLSASEALYAARLVGEFIKANQLPEPRGDWQNNLNFPKP